MNAPLFVGLDAGGTKTAALASSGDSLIRLTGPGAQALRDGTDAAAAIVADLVGQARKQADAPLAAVAVGFAGAGREDTRTAIAESLRASLGLEAVAVVHDGDVAYRAAWGTGSGALLIAGTGSFVYAKAESGNTVRAGGWGSALGDDGSGTALGKAALRVLLAHFDGGPPTSMPELAAERFGLSSREDVIRAVYNDAVPLASFAPLLLSAVEAGDWASEVALRAETNALAKQAGWIATRLGDDVEHRLRYTGGLSGEPAYQSALEGALERHLPGWDVAPCTAEPVEGALALARSLVEA
ncbi:BadF/BadG/BcrA/BcrD ATPase family protein [Rubrivirga sp.]|uniref:BadF/BadG/BcrA/BcrD ATPase family protein n=1 Tax=Rubrivirga sp. TaxID=1885344 RepID=UPI003C7861B1